MKVAIIETLAGLGLGAKGLHLRDMQVYTTEEISKEVGGDIKEVFEGDYSYVVCYSDHPDYCFVSEGDNLEKVLSEWITNDLIKD